MATHNNDTCPVCAARLTITGPIAEWYRCPKCSAAIAVSGCVTDSDGARVLTFDLMGTQDDARLTSCRSSLPCS